MLKIPIIERKERKHRIAFSIAIVLLAILVVLSINDIIKENLIGIILIVIIVGFIATVFIIKNYIKIGYLALNEEEINIYSNNKIAKQKFKITEIQRLRLIFSGIRGDISNSNLRGLAVVGILQINEGINRIEIIDFDGQIYQFEIVLDSASIADIVEREFIMVSKNNEGKIEILKESRI